jgi:hypothetical protein
MEYCQDQKGLTTPIPSSSSRPSGESRQDQIRGNFPAVVDGLLGDRYQEIARSARRA